MEKNNTRRRDYCFTLNNFTDADLEDLKKLEENPRLRYIIAGNEVGEEGTKHIQGYVYFHNATLFSFLKKALPRAHIEACRGTPDENITYCSKDGEFYEKGERPISQKRRGEQGKEYWEEQFSIAKRGKIEECDPKLIITHFNALNAIAAKYAPMPEDNELIHNQWYYGETGTGKSMKARSENPGCYLKMCNKWWDGYNNEDVVLIEDFDKKHEVLGHHLKIWADRYSFPAEVKGSKLNLRPRSIIVTSNWHPKEIWPTEPQTLEPILRRFHVTHFNKNLNSV